MRGARGNEGNEVKDIRSVWRKETVIGDALLLSG